MSRDGGSDATECPSCGTQADAGDRFCSACGTVLARGQDGESTAPSPPTESPTGPGAETAGAADGRPSDGKRTDGRPTDGERSDESEEMVWATDPASPSPEDTSTGAQAADVASDGDDSPREEPTATGSAEAPESHDRNESGHRAAAPGRNDDAVDDGWTETLDADEATLEPWQKRCPECDSVLVAQAVRCTSCGARQSDGDESEGDDDGGRQPPAQQEASDTPESPPRRREADESHYRERPRRERRDDPRERRPPRDRTPDGRTTDAGGGEVQYERERRAEPVASEREPPRAATGGYRERSRRERPPREPPRREPPRRSASERNRRERLADRQATRRVDEETPYEPSVPSSRWWAGVLLPAVLTALGAAVGIAADPTAVAGGTLPWVGDGGGLLELGVVLAPTLAPFALYFDRRYVAHETGRTPSAAYYLVVVPYLNLVVTGLYLWWRQQWLAEA